MTQSHFIQVCRANGMEMFSCFVEANSNLMIIHVLAIFCQKWANLIFFCIPYRPQRVNTKQTQLIKTIKVVHMLVYTRSSFSQ